MTLRFEAFHPTRLVFGAGTLLEAGKYSRPYGRRALVVTSRAAMSQLGYTQRLIKNLEASGISLAVFKRLDQTPSLENVDEGAELARLHIADFVIGLGGGSALDCAKAVAAVAPSRRQCADFLYGRSQIDEATLPIIAIPTTAGTGSEANRAAVLTDTVEKHKDALRSDFLFPRVALVDSQLTHHVPKLVTAQTGFDAFAHALESYVSPLAQPIASLRALRAMRSVIKWLPIALEAPETAVAREQLMLASTSMGYNLSAVGTCLPHRLDKPLCARFPHIAHGQAIALFYPNWVSQSWQGAPKKFARIARLLNSRLAKLSVGDAAAACSENLRDFIERLGLFTDGSQLGIHASEIELEQMAQRVRGDIQINPVPVQREQLVEHYRRALDSN